MKLVKKISLTILITHMSIILYGQSDCDFYIDELTKNDTLKVSIVFFINRSEVTENILIYKDESKKYNALMNSDNFRDTLIELTNSKIEKIRLFEQRIRKQKIESNIPIYLHSLVEYQISFKNNIVSYSSKDQFYSLYKELLDRN